MSNSEYVEEPIVIPRNRMFVLSDGTFVVQWEEDRVQGLLSGRYYPYDDTHFGNAITDYELNQLMKSGVVAEYDDEMVSLLPELTMQNPGRSYYLNTGIHKSQVFEVKSAMMRVGLDSHYGVRVQEIFVIIRGVAGRAFMTFDEAERARETLQRALPDVLDNLAVSFVEHVPNP